MRLRLIVGVLTSMLPAFPSFAIDFPNHADICVDGIVSKEKLAKAILKQNSNWSRLYIDASDAGSEPKWRRMLTDDKFCVKDPGCLGPPSGKAIQSSKKPPQDYSVANEILGRLRFEVAEAIQTNVDGRYYSMTNRNIGTDYFLGKDTQSQITCVGPDIPEAPKATVLKLPVRLRANSDDLNIDAGRDKNLFKTVKPATVSFTRDGIQKSNATKLQTALGYAIPISIDGENSQTFNYFNGEVVPYISTSQSTTKVDGKAATLADTNNVAVGTLFNSQAVFNSLPDVNNVFVAKPQYLWNTKDKSEIASLKFIYQPWTRVLNTPIQLGRFLEATWLTLIFDLRDDVGEYTKIGIDPKTALMHTSFHRAGSKFGFAVSTLETGPHLVLTVTETLLYGFAGSLRQLNLFDSTLSYYFDSTSNLAFTVSYSKGRPKLLRPDFLPSFSARLSSPALSRHR